MFIVCLKLIQKCLQFPPEALSPKSRFFDALGRFTTFLKPGIFDDIRAGKTTPIIPGKLDVPLIKWQLNVSEMALLGSGLLNAAQGDPAGATIGLGGYATLRLLPSLLKKLG